ncbi:MAG: hypothetical protein JJ902_03345 [Roseibium sp.]|nr:hypothetical protein [Roseibium sp.]
MRPYALAALMVLCLAAVPGSAKTVRTDTIEVEPPEAEATTVIPVEDLNIPSDEVPSGIAGEVDDAAGAMSPPDVFYDTGLLPKPVQRMHAQLKEAALSGDLNRLRMILESNEVPPTLSLTEIGDPIDFLKESSGDGEGYEILAILADTLEAGFVHVDVGTPQEMYIWPYFARYPLTDLTPHQRVELYRIVTSGDFAEMELFGVWLFYRVGIGPDGTLHYFVAGE